MAISAHATAQVDFSDVFSKLKMEVRADGECTTTDTTPSLGFHGKYFNIMIGGDLGGHFSYYFKQRIVANPGTVTFFDNTDFLYLDYKPTQNWRIRFGKDAMALGGFEYDASPIDVYFPTNMWRNIYCFQLGASGAHISNDGNHTLIAQVTNSPYINYGDLSYDAGLVSYNLYWAGNMGHFHTLWSTSMVEYKWGYFLNMIMLGNQLTYDKWDIYFDIMHHALSWNDWGKNIGFVSCANYYFTPYFNHGGEGHEVCHPRLLRLHRPPAGGRPHLGTLRPGIRVVPLEGEERAPAHLRLPHDRLIRPRCDTACRREQSRRNRVRPYHRARHRRLLELQHRRHLDHRLLSTLSEELGMRN